MAPSKIILKYQRFLKKKWEAPHQVFILPTFVAASREINVAIFDFWCGTIPGLKYRLHVKCALYGG
jgi:hypothetical protein